jgi:hypothetical protein
MTTVLKFRAPQPKHSLVRLSLPTGLIAATVLALVGAPAAFAESNNSLNWAGYAVHRPGVSFKEVSSAWKQPSVSCKPGNQTYSAMWVGLGGYDMNSPALEQIGTEVDCNSNGKVASSAWYELVPSPSHTIPYAVRPGDTMAAKVSVTGQKVELGLADTTRHWSFTRTFHVSSVDVSSAEWILEAPSACISPTACAVLPLANFRHATFGFAKAQSTTGKTGTISSRNWGRTKITLSPGGRRYVAYNGSGTPAGAAKPSGLAASGSSFELSYQTVSVQTQPFLAQRVMPRAAYLMHVGLR